MDPLARPHASSPTAQIATESNRWRLPDLIDFEYYVDADERAIREFPTERKRLTERDREWYLEHIRDRVKEFSPEHSPRHRAATLRRWLECRRGKEDPALRPLLPGSTFARSQRLVTFGLGILGLVIGAGVASVLLQYDGKHPVNVSWYLFVLVLLQLLLAGATIGAWVLRQSRPLRTAMQDLSLLSHFIRPLFSRVAGWIQRQRLAHAPADARDRAKAKAGLLHSHYALYGAASYLPMLIAAQVFGIGFNIGAISTTVSLEWFSDLAFGWGSALDVQPQTIHELARIIALPWSWAFGEGLGYPTLEQIAGSRISLKDPLSKLDAGDLRSWRWFLVLAVITYGLLPRIALLAASVLAQRRSLAALPFTHQKTQGVYARMVTPCLETAISGSGKGPEMPIPKPLNPLTAPTAAPGWKPPPEPRREAPLEPRPRPSARKPKTEPPRAEPTRPLDKPSEPPDERPPKPAEKQDPHGKGEQPADGRSTSTPDTAIASDACTLMIHLDVSELLGEPDQVRLQQMLLTLTGWRVAVSVTIGGGSAMADQALSLVRNGQWEAPPPRIAIVLDGSQPPITEHLRFLRAVREQAGAQAQILLALVGDPEGEDPLPPLSDFDFSDWQRKIEQMADPYLRLETLAPPVPTPTPVEEVPR